MMHYVLAASVVFFKLELLNRATDLIVPVYSVVVLVLMLGGVKLLGISNPSSGNGERKVYASKKKVSASKEGEGSVDTRDWRDCFDGSWEVVEHDFDKWMTWAGVGYVARSIAIRMKARMNMALTAPVSPNEPYSYFFKRCFMGPRGPTNAWSYETNNLIGTSYDGATPVQHAFEKDQRPFFRVWFDEEKKALIEEQGPKEGADDPNKSNLKTWIQWTRRVERGATPAEDRLISEWKGVKLSDGSTCSMGTVHKRIESLEA